MNRESLHRLLKSYGVSLRKGDDKNFLISDGALQRIADEVVEEKGDRVIEIGAGVGNLTLYLLKRGAHVTAIEKDPLLFNILRTEMERFLGEGLNLLEQDILTFDFSSVCREEGTILCGNIPYSISTPLMVNILCERRYFKKVVLLLQREFGARLFANRGCRGYGALSVLMQNFMSIECLDELSPRLFYPMPDVHSILIRMKPVQPVVFTDIRDFFDFLRRIFGMRRKKLRNILTKMVSDTERVSALLSELGLKGEERPETIDPRTFLDLFNLMFHSR